MLSNGPERDRITGHWRERHCEELQDLYFSPNNIQIIKSTKMSFAGLVALTGEIKRACSVLVGKLKNRPLGSFSNR
jgi:hypothetical protein